MKRMLLMALCALLLMSLCSVALADQTVTLFADDAETGTITDKWTVKDDDGDGYKWYYTSIYGSNSGLNVLSSESYNDAPGSLTPDNWIISKNPISIPANATSVTWELYSAAYYGWPEPCELYVGTTSEPREMQPIGDFVEYNGSSFIHRTYDLSAYAGQNIYIALRHNDSCDNWALLIDDIKVTAVVPDTPVVPDAPETGDATPLYLLAALLLTSAAGLALTRRKCRA